MNQTIESYGVTPTIKETAATYESLFLARVIMQQRGLYRLVGEEGELDAVVSGKLAHQLEDAVQFPAVGDWVMVDRTQDT